MKKNLPIILQLLDKFGVNALFRFFNRHRALIVWYHGVCDDDFTLLRGYDERHIPKSLFQQQLDFLRRRKYVFVTLSELVEALKGGKKTKKWVAITFDDGFKNVVENAYPIMKKVGAKGCFYLVSNLMGTSELLWTDEIEAVLGSAEGEEFVFHFQNEPIRYNLSSLEERHRAMKDIKRRLRAIPNSERLEHLKQFRHNAGNVPQEFLFASWEQVKRLDPSILEVGSHTKNHPDCRSLSDEREFEDELLGSKINIESITGYPVKHFCYPGASSFDKQVIGRVNAYVEKYGYISATSTIPGFNDETSNPFMLKRIVATEDFQLFKAATSGSFLALTEALERLCEWRKKVSTVLSGAGFREVQNR